MEPPGAERLFGGLEQAARALGLPEVEAKVSVQRAAWLRDHGRVAEAAAVLAAADRPESGRVLPKVLVDLADLQRHEGRFVEAEATLDRAERSLDPKEPFHRVVRAEALGVRGQLRLHQGRPEQAARFLERSLAIARELRDRGLLVGALVRRMNLALAVEDPERVVALADLAAELGCETGPLLVRRGIAEAEMERDDPKRPSRAAATLVEALARDDLTASDRIDALIALGELEVRSGALDEAEGRLDEAEAWLSRQSGDALGILSRQRRRLLTVRAACALARPAGQERLRALRDEMERALTAFLDEWSARPPRPDGKGFLHFGDTRAFLSERIRLWLATDRDRGVEQAARGTLAAEALGTLARATGAQALTPAEARATLRPGEAAFWFLPAPDRSHLFLFDRARVVHFLLPSDVVLFERRRAFDEALRSPDAPVEEIRARGAALRDALLPPQAFERARAFPRWTIVGIDRLGTVPFEALPLGASRFVGLAHAVSYLPSFAVGTRLAARPAAREGKYAVFAFGGPPSRAGPTLRFDEERLEALFGARLPARLRHVRGEEATRRALLEGLAGASRLAIVWTHGTRDPERERPVGLECADGVVFADDVERTEAPPLVVLAACGAARGPVRRGEDGASHLGGAFLRAGARCVVLPSAEVDDGATAALLAEAFRRLAAGADPAEALRAARADLFARDGMSDPRALCLIHAFGLGHVEAAWPAGGRKPLWLWIFAALGLSLAMRSLSRRPARRR